MTRCTGSMNVSNTMQCNFKFQVDHLVFGKISKDTVYNENPEEVEQTRWIPKLTLERWLEGDTRNMTPWFRMISKQILFGQNLWDRFMANEPIENKDIVSLKR